MLGQQNIKIYNYGMLLYLISYARYSCTLCLFLFLFRIGLFVVFDIQYDFAVRFRLLIGTFVIIYKRYTSIVLFPQKNWLVFITLPSCTK